MLLQVGSGCGKDSSRGPEEMMSSAVICLFCFALFRFVSVCLFVCLLACVCFVIWIHLDKSQFSGEEGDKGKANVEEAPCSTCTFSFEAELLLLFLSLVQAWGWGVEPLDFKHSIHELQLRCFAVTVSRLCPSRSIP